MCLALLACTPQDARPALVPAVAAERLGSTAADGDAVDLLRTLFPAPHGDVRVTYEVEGPAGLTGTLVLTTGVGGFRHETWLFELPRPAVVGDAAPEPALPTITGTRITTPEYIWTRAGSAQPSARRSPLGELARAHAALEPGLRTLVDVRIGEWSRELEHGRVQHPGTQVERLGQSCLVTHVGPIELCMWEEAGVPLSYRGEAFSVMARQIEADLDLPDNAFAIPDPSNIVAPVDPIAARRSANDVLARVAGGDMVELANWKRPALSL
jgi:hypothetical protein